MPEGRSLSAASHRWVEVLRRLQRFRQPSPQVRGVLLLVATVATLVAVVVAVGRLDLRWAELRWLPLLAAALLVTPATIGLNAAELRAMAHLSAPAARDVGWGEATRAVVLATAANLLPVPAGALIRLQVLRSAGAQTGPASAVTLVAAGVWIGAALTLAGAAVLWRSSGEAAVAVGAAGIGLGVVAMVGSLISIRRIAPARWPRGAAALLVVEVATAVLHAARLWLVLVGLGAAAELWQALVIGAASPLAAAAGFFPGGIGLAELLGALLAPLAGLGPALALLAIAVGRVLGLAVTLPVAFWLGLGDVIRRVEPSERH